MSESHGFHLHRAKAPLPGATDFDPWSGNLDARHAWKNFGGLGLDQAHRLFLENPHCYQEDFMFMGPVAFDYYFPVVDRYLREFRRADDAGDDGCAWILGAAMESQIETMNPRPLAAGTVMEISALANFVLSEIDRYAGEPRGHRRISAIWRKARRLADERVASA
jgi:hypothetical protein